MCVELCQGLVEAAVVVLESVCLVHNQHGPADGAEEVLVLQKDLVGCHENIKLELASGVAPLILTNLRGWGREGGEGVGTTRLSTQTRRPAVPTISRLLMSPRYTTTLSSGAHEVNSRCQATMVDRGTTIRKGP